MDNLIERANGAVYDKYWKPPITREKFANALADFVLTEQQREWVRIESEADLPKIKERFLIKNLHYGGFVEIRPFDPSLSKQEWLDDVLAYTPIPPYHPAEEKENGK